MAVNIEGEEKALIEEQVELRKSFRWWRLVLPMVFGVLAVTALLWKELRHTSYEQVPTGTGAFAWIDQNNNGRADVDDRKEFVSNAHGDYRAVSGAERLRHVHLAQYGWLMILCALIANALRDIGYMSRLRILTRGEFSWRRAFRITALWEFANAVAPAILGGTSAAIYMIHRERVALGRSAAIVLVTAMLDELFFLVFAPFVFFSVGIDRLFPPNLDQALWGLPIQTLFWIGYTFIAVMKLSVFYSVFFRPRAIKFLLVNFFKRKWLRRLRPRIAEVGDDLIAASDEFKDKTPTFWLKAIAATWCSWGSRFLVLNFLAAAFFPVGSHLLMYARQIVLWVVLLISPTPGASGAAEFAFVGFMRDLLPAGALLVVVALLWRLLTYYLYLFVGAIVLPRWLRVTSGKR